MAGERRLPGLGLWGFWNQGSNTWKPGTDENNRRLSAFVQGAASSRTAASPTSPADGAVWIVPSTANANQGRVAIRDNGETIFLDPPAGLRMFVRDTGTFAYFDGTVWKDEEAGEVFTFTGLSDTPDAFGAPGQVLAVSPDGSALVFIDPPTGGGGGPAELPPITNNAGKVLAVNAEATGVEWIDPPSGGGGGESFIGAPLGTPYGLTGTFSSTTMPTKGLVFAPTKNVRINAVLALLDGYDANTDSYHAQIVELNSDNSVKAVLATSASVVPNTASPTSVRFALTTAVVIAAGKRYGFNLVREPVGRNQTICPVLVSFFWGVSFSGSIEYAVLNYAVVDPPVGSAATVTANSIPNIWFEGAQA